MTAITDWPSALPLFEKYSWHLRARVVTPGPGLDGRQQVLATENRTWTATLGMPQLLGAQALLLNSVADALQGGFGRLRLPVCNRHTPRFLGDVSTFLRGQGISAAAEAEGFQRYSDGTRFTDGTGFALPDHAEPTVAAAVPVGATIVTLYGYLGRNLLPGAYFSHDDFLYRVTTNADGVIVFVPPLRAALAAGDQVQVSAPTIVVRIASDSALRVVETHHRISDPVSFDVVEAFDR